MGNHLAALLDAWQAGRDQPWVLGTVYRTEGSAYRKAGAMMLIDGLGRRFGLLSGGCIEADIVRNAAKVLANGRAATLVYDGADEDDLSYRLGVGCGGKVFILLQPVTAEADLGLAAVAQALRQRRSGLYHQRLPNRAGEVAGWFEDRDSALPAHSAIEQRDGGRWLVTPIRPDPHLLIVGGGIDACPLADMAKRLGWHVTLADPRPSHARREHFPGADFILRDLGPDLAAHARAHRADLAVLMAHSIALDAQALRSLTAVDLRHVALLGPRHRFRRVLERAGLTEATLPWPASGPAGLDIGGQLPESVALSILAEGHAALHRPARQPVLRIAAP